MLYVDKKKHTGLARYTYNDLKTLYKKYHVKAEKNNFESQDAKDATLELEKIFNELIDIQNKFDYNFFIIVVKGLFDDSVSVEFFDKDKPPRAKFDNFEFRKIPGKFRFNVEK